MRSFDFQTFINRLVKGADNVLFRDVIKAVTNQDIQEVGKQHAQVIDAIRSVLKHNLVNISTEVEEGYKGRANELGNYLETVLVEYLKTVKGFKPSRSVGYPDITLDANGQPIYIECKIYQKKTVDSTLRSFYFKVSDKNKIRHSCPHILIGFEVESLGGENKSPFKVKGFRIVDLYNLKVNLKPEFNASNPMIYKECRNL